MLSALSQGYGTWDGLTNVTGPESLPTLAMLSEHKHGVTVKSARRRKPQIVRVEEIDGSIHMPKTYLTRKGALVLYSSEQSVEDTKQPRKPIDVEKVIERLGNVRRLMASILYLNDSQVDDTDISVSDERNKVYMGFLRSVDNVLYKQRIQPGQDLKFYLKTLQLRARKLMELAGSDIARQISELLCTPVLSSRPSTSGTLATRKLSSAKLTASLKSDSYMGRKVLYPALDTSLHEMLNTPFSTSTWPLSQRHAIPNLHDSKIEEIDTECSDQRSHSAGHVSEKRHKGRLNSAISTNSGSMVEDLTLFEEVDISLPSDNGALEPDSDIENEYFNTVLNYDELPKDELREASGKDRRDIAANSSIERHLTNTPDMESSYMDAEVKSGSIMTPDITLRSGHSGTFNILNSQISKHDDASLVNTHAQQSSPQLSHGKRLGSSQDSSKEDTSLLVNQSQVMPESSDPAGSKSNQNSRSSSQHLSRSLEDAEASKPVVDSSLSKKKEPSKQQQMESHVSQLDERITLQSVPHSPTDLTDRTHSSTSSKRKKHTLPTVNNIDDDTSQKVEIPDSQFTEGRENLQLPLIRGASGKPSSIRSPVSAGSKGRSAKSSPLISASSKADPQVNVTPILSEPPPPKTKPEITYRLPPPNTIQTQPKVPTVPKINKIRDADKEALKRAEKMQKDEQKALEALMRDPDEVKEIMTSNMAEEFDETGLSLEELELAREMLNQRMAEAEKDDDTHS
ncbi:serine-rich adhesin for platelets-like [Watersipora subatra]|uniref:serine-rich adhesin for platelets-like n=1 Tax=Watersipora subatra TaxID=2589382 RepID=UPI00355BF39D